LGRRGWVKEKGKFLMGCSWHYSKRWFTLLFWFTIGEEGPSLGIWGKLVPRIWWGGLSLVPLKEDLEGGWEEVFTSLVVKLGGFGSNFLRRESGRKLIPETSSNQFGKNLLYRTSLCIPPIILLTFFQGL